MELLCLALLVAVSSAGSIYSNADLYQQKGSYDTKAVYYGKFNYACSSDGFYFYDDHSFVICSHGTAYYQPCAPGTKNSDIGRYQHGSSYTYRDFCDVNLLNYGYHDNYDSSYKPAYKADYAQPAYKDDYAQPAYKDDYVQPAYKADYAQPAYKADYAQPAYKADYAQPAYKADYAQPAYKGEYAQPAYKADYAQPAYKADYAQPAYKADYAQPAYKADYAQPAYKADYAQPSYSDYSKDYNDKADYAKADYAKADYSKTEYAKDSYSPATADYKSDKDASYNKKY